METSPAVAPDMSVDSWIGLKKWPVTAHTAPQLIATATPENTRVTRQKGGKICRSSNLPSLTWNRGPVRQQPSYVRAFLPVLAFTTHQGRTHLRVSNKLYHRGYALSVHDVQIFTVVY
jgi:hypothetical protein